MFETICILFCFSTSGVGAAPVEDFCERYERQVLSEEEAEQIMQLPRALRDRIQGNELDYLCQCRQWNNPICDSTRQ